MGSRKRKAQPLWYPVLPKLPLEEKLNEAPALNPLPLSVASLLKLVVLMSAPSLDIKNQELV
ncbi:hypothetical protein L484_016943 [Morus notabilis]|uniref:Uncharacterized protein n=1 Tax=Morus notabilis TaxID=981085 RepID=W9QQS3_9ROSA|nr:hypothetical protein L484_016943 [Morus notabilis]